MKKPKNKVIKISYRRMTNKEMVDYWNLKVHEQAGVDGGYGPSPVKFIKGEAYKEGNK